MSTERKKVETLAEAPLELIKDLAQNYESVWVVVKRHGQQGQWASIGPRVMKPTMEVAALDDWIRELAGGGKFRVEAVDPADPTKHLLPPFWVHIEGPPKAVASSRRAIAAPVGASPALVPHSAPPPYGQTNPNWHTPQEPPDPSAYWSQTPDALAFKQAQDYKQELLDERKRREDERQQFSDRIQHLTNQIAEMNQRHNEETARRDREAAEARAKADREALLARIEQAERKEPPKFTDYAAMITAMAPVLTALVDSGKSKQELTTNFQQKSMETQLSSISSVMTAAMKKDDGGVVKMFEVVIPLLVPLVQKMFEERSPTKMAELVGSMGESQMTMLSVLSQFIQQFAGEDSDQPWMKMLREGLRTVESITEQMAETAHPRQPQPQGPSQPQAPLAGQPQQPQGPLGQLSAQQIANAIVNSPDCPEELRGKDWYEVFISLHNRVVPSQVAEQIAQTLEQASDRGRKLAPMFVGFYESDKKPSEHLEQLLEMIPIWEDSAYCKQVLEAFDAQFTEEDAPASSGNGADPQSGFGPMAEQPALGNVGSEPFDKKPDPVPQS